MSDAQRKAVVLFSGGLDSTTVLAHAQHEGYFCHALTVSYGQRHAAEIRAAAAVIARLEKVSHRVVEVDLGGIGGSALTDPSIPVPDRPGDGVPSTYVPARNTIMLSIALGWAEVLGAEDIFIGVNAVDYSGYPDCRPAFINAFEKLANLATKAATEDGRQFQLHAPLIELSKAQIIQRGEELGVDFAATVSCYQADEQGRACGRCDSCRLRRAGFETAGIADPTRYQ